MKITKTTKITKTNKEVKNMDEKRIETLDDTVKLMTDKTDYSARFVAEYWQTKIRYDKLHKLLIKAEANTLDFKPDCPISLLRDQARSMGEYLHCLEIRAEIEDIIL